MLFSEFSINLLFHYKSSCGIHFSFEALTVVKQSHIFRIRERHHYKYNNFFQGQIRIVIIIIILSSVNLQLRDVSEWENLRSILFKLYENIVALLGLMAEIKV